MTNIFKALFSKKVPKSQRAHLEAFKKKIDLILYEYIKLDLESSENALFVTNKRSTRIRSIIQH